MIDVQVFGTSCAACVALEKNVGAAVAELGEGYRVEKVGQLLEMVRLGVTQLPALAVAGEVRSMGRVLEVPEIKAMLAAAAKGAP